MANGYFALVLHAHLPFVRHPEDPTVMEEHWLYEAITGTYLPLLQTFEGLIADHVPFRVHGLAVGAAHHDADRRSAEGPLRRAPRQADRARREGDRPHQARAALPAARATCTATASSALRHTWRCHDGNLVRAFRQLAGGRPRRGHHLDGDARLLPADGSQLGHHPRPGSRRRRSVREALRPPPARHVAGRVRLRARRRRAAARGGRPLLLRRHARHPVRRPPPAVRRLRAALLPERRRRLRPRHRVVRAGLERPGGLPRRPALPRLLPRHRLRPAARVHQPVHPPGRAPRCTPASSTTPSPTTSCTTSGSTIRTSRAARRACTPRTSAATAKSRCSRLRGAAWTGRRSSSARTTPSSTATGGSRGRCSWATSSASCTSTSTTSRRSRRATTSIATTPTRSPRPARRRGATRATTSTGSTRPTPGPTATCTSPPSAWSSWRAATRAPTRSPPRALNQAARELMLAQSSDWTFIMRTGTTVPYATKRINEHIVQFNKLYDDLRGAKVNERWLDRRRVAEQHFPADRLPYLRQLSRLVRARRHSQGSVRRLRVRPVRQDRRPGRRRGRAAEGAARAGHRRPRRDAALRGHALERARACWTACCRCRCGGARRAARVRLGQLPDSDVPVYCLEFNRYFDRPYLYGPPGEGYPDNLERFTFLSRGALELCKALGFFPDVIHCNDWQTALVPVYVNTVEWMQPLHGAATVYSIHNLAYQGVFDGGGMFITGLGREHYNPRRARALRRLNLTKGALHHSTLLSTVSPTYAREIQTGAYGCGLDGVLAARSGDLRRHPERHRRRRVEPGDGPPPARDVRRQRCPGKAACKAALQKEAGFAVRPDVPLFGVIGRLTSQKGFDVLAHALDRILGWDVQIVLLGTGDPDAERFFAWADAHRGDRFRAWLRLRQRPRAPHRGRRRLLPDAVALRALRPQPDVQPALRHAAGRARDGRPGRHRPELRRGDRRRHRLHVHRPQPRVAGQHHRLGGLDLVRSPRAHRRRCGSAPWSRTSPGTAPRRRTTTSTCAPTKNDAGHGFAG